MPLSASNVSFSGPNKLGTASSKWLQNGIHGILCALFSVIIIGIVSSVSKLKFYLFLGGCRMVRWCWVNLQRLDVLSILIIVGQGPTALTVGADGGC